MIQISTKRKGGGAGVVPGETLHHHGSISNTGSGLEL